MSLPIACNLSSRAFQERRQTVLQKLRSAAVEVKEVEQGYAYSFLASADRLRELAELIDFERQCCPFLQFRLTLEANNGPLWLEMSGPDGTKEFLAETFNTQQ